MTGLRAEQAAVTRTRGIHRGIGIATYVEITNPDAGVLRGRGRAHLGAGRMRPSSSTPAGEPEWCTISITEQGQGSEAIIDPDRRRRPSASTAITSGCACSSATPKRDALRRRRPGPAGAPVSAARRPWQAEPQAEGSYVLEIAGRDPAGGARHPRHPATTRSTDADRHAIRIDPAPRSPTHRLLPLGHCCPPDVIPGPELVATRHFVAARLSVRLHQRHPRQPGSRSTSRPAS